MPKTRIRPISRLGWAIYDQRTTLFVSLYRSGAPAFFRTRLDAQNSPYYVAAWHKIVRIKQTTTAL